MRDYSKVSSHFWTGEIGIRIRSLGIETQLVAIYLLTCSHANMIEIYYMPAVYIAHDVGIELPNVNAALESLKVIDFCLYDQRTEYVWIIEMAKDQFGEQLDPRDKRVKAINLLYRSLPELPYLDKFFQRYSQRFFIEDRKNINQT